MLSFCCLSQEQVLICVLLFHLLQVLCCVGLWQVYETARTLSEYLGKTVCISLDRPGFIVNRILMPMINEAFYTLMEVFSLK